MSDFVDFQSIADDGTAIHGSDRSAIVRFEEMTFPDEEASAKTGYQKFLSKDMIYIRFAGSNNEHVREVLKTDTATQLSDLRRFPRQWDAYINQRVQVPDGVPLEQWAVLNKAQALELKSMGIHTVEQLSAVSDANLTWMGARQMRDNALAWLEEAEAGSAVIKLRAENESLKLEIVGLKNQLEALNAIKKEQVENVPFEVQDEIEIKPIKRIKRVNNG